MSSSEARCTFVSAGSVTGPTRWMTFVTWKRISTSSVTCSMAWGADSVFWVNEFVHGAVAETSVIGVAVVAGKAAFVGDVCTEIVAFITPVVEIVHKSFKVVDHTEGGSKIEVNISVGEDHVW